jgi:hypothetical protein
MTHITADEHKRVRLPDARPRQVFAYEILGGTIPLKPVAEIKPKPARARLVAGSKGYLVVETDRAITQEEVRQALNEFP